MLTISSSSPGVALMGPGLYGVDVPIYKKWWFWLGVMGAGTGAYWLYKRSR